MGQIMIKKRRALNDESFDILMTISHRQEPLTSPELDQIIDTGKSLRDRRIFFKEYFLNFSLILTLSAPTQQNGQTHSNNSPAVCR